MAVAAILKKQRMRQHVAGKLGNQQNNNSPQICRVQSMCTDQSAQFAGLGSASRHGVGVADGGVLLDPDQGHRHSQLVGTHLCHLHTGRQEGERQTDRRNVGEGERGAESGEGGKEGGGGETDRQTNRQTDRWPDRQKQRETDGQTETKR